MMKLFRNQTNRLGLQSGSKVIKRNRFLSSLSEPIKPSLSHVDAQNRPCMVDISDKGVTARTAHAQVVIKSCDFCYHHCHHYYHGHHYHSPYHQHYHYHHH
jgi:hypothetical protein